jgi:hypothetical protein
MKNVHPFWHLSIGCPGIFSIILTQKSLILIRNKLIDFQGSLRAADKPELFDIQPANQEGINQLCAKCAIFRRFTVVSVTGFFINNAKRSARRDIP